MNTSNIKKYAPKARADFITAVSKRLNQFGIYADKNDETTISEVTIDGSVMQVDGNSFDASLAKSRQKLVEQTKQQGFNQFVEHTAYTWFNRLCAIRYMELHDYLEHGLRVLSHPDKENSFEILDHAQDIAQDLGLNRDHIIELKLAGNQDEQLYRELLIGQCHKLHQAMPFLFEALDDETELLLPDNLTRTDSLLRGLVNDIPEQDWQQVEIIGWLYQFYISEKKDQVIGKVVKSEDIPAATQLFTPNWIVKYLVQNSVGRQWLQTYPDSTIKEAMEYYIEPAKQTEAVGAALAANTPNSIDPETIKVLDPACGSGHILVEAYQVLKAIYEERGYRSRDIPKLILENNLYGLDIDDRAAQLAGFTVMMLARADDRRIFTREVQLNIMAMVESSNIDLESLFFAIDNNRHSREGGNPEAVDLKTILKDLIELFKQAKTFGSLITVPANIADTLPSLKTSIQQIADSGDLFAKSSALALLPIIQQAEILANQYDAVVANPPYMGGGGMNVDLKKFAKDNYPNSKSDLFAIFIERCLDMGGNNAQLGLVTPYVWMFINSYERLRNRIVGEHILTSLIQLEYNAFAPACIPVCTFTISKQYIPKFTGSYIRLSDFKGHEQQAPKTLEAIKNPDCSWFHEAKPNEFKCIPSTPFAYWIGDKVRNVFKNNPAIGDIANAVVGLQTGDNDRFLRLWHEVDLKNIGFGFKNREQAQESYLKWFPYNKGGKFRKWYGNREYIVNWANDGEEVRSCVDGNGRLRSRPQNTDYYFRTSVSWSALSSGGISLRYSEPGSIFDTKGQSIFAGDIEDLFFCMAILNSNAAIEFMSILAPTLDFNAGSIAKVAICKDENYRDIIENAKEMVLLSKNAWNSFESAMDFKHQALVSLGNKQQIKTSYDDYIIRSEESCDHMMELEITNNSLINSSYGLDNRTLTDVPISKVTLNTNPYYRYGSDSTDSKLKRRLQCDTVAELISYAIGCMMGRYSLDREGLVYAHAGNEGFAELEQQGAYNTFPADDDGIIPLTDQEWFEDDVTLRFREFVQTVWGQDNLQANLDFVAQSLCLHAIKPKSGETSLDIIRRYLSNQFYKDHLKTYKKRPIYWLFSSGKQKAFECLVYLHRYNAGTLARMRTEYVTPLLGKYQATADLLTSQIEQASSTADGNRLSKSLTALEKKQTELREFDDKLKHHADMQIALDLDDGVKVNYGKFGELLVDVKAVTGKK